MKKNYVLPYIRRAQFSYCYLLDYPFPLLKKPDLQPTQECFFTNDLPQKMSEQFGLHGQPCFGSIAAQGEQVFDTMKAMIN